MYEFWSKYHLPIGNSNLPKNHCETSYLLNKLNVLFEIPVYNTIADVSECQYFSLPPIWAGKCAILSQNDVLGGVWGLQMSNVWLLTLVPPWWQFFSAADWDWFENKLNELLTSPTLMAHRLLIFGEQTNNQQNRYIILNVTSWDLD